MSVYKNNRGKWIVDIDDFVHADGRPEPRIRKTCPVQRKDAGERYEREIRNRLLDGTFGKYAKTADDVPTLEAFQEKYLLFYRAEKRKQTGVYNSTSIFKKHLIPLFGAKRMDGFDANDELSLKAHFAEHSASRYNQAAANINGAIGLFHRIKKLAGEPFSFGRLKVDEVTKPFYDFDKYARLLSAARRIGVISELVVLLGRDAGLRRGEMWGLSPDQCRMRERRLIIERAETIVGVKRYMGFTKGREMRTLDMTPAIHDCLTRYFAKYGKRERMVADSEGVPFNQKSFQAFMRAIEQNAELPETGEVHILRHTFCSHMAILGVPVIVIQQLAGHKQLTTTLGYMHLAPGDTKMGINALSQPVGHGNATATAAE